jgi:transposase
MGKPLGVDLRRRVVSAIEGGLSTRKAAAGAWARLKRRTGDITPKPQGSPEGSRLDAHESFILALIEADKDITLSEMADRLESDHGLRVVPSTIWYFLDRRGITFKENRARERAAKGGRPAASARLVRGTA